MAEMEKAAVYLRMSDKAQDKSPDQQRDEIHHRYGNDYKVIREYLDGGKTGSSDTEKRTEFLQMLADSARREWTVILCYDVSRFGRLDSIDGAEHKKLLRDNGVKLVTVKDGAIDWNTLEGRIMDGMRSEMAHAYSVGISRDSLRGKKDAFLRGQGYGQTTPYGLARLVVDPLGNEHHVARTVRFRRPKDWTQKFVLGDEEEVTVVRWLFTEFDSRDVSYHQLAKELNDKNIPSPNGGRWVYIVVQRLLENARYAGDLSLGRNASGKMHRLLGEEIVPSRGKAMKTRQKGLLIKGTHEFIIARELFDSVQTKIALRSKGKGKPFSHGAEGFTLTGIVLCGNCGKPMYGVRRTNPRKHKVGVHYRCKGFHRHYDFKCGQWHVYEPEFLPFLLRTLLKAVDEKLSAKAEAKPPVDNDRRPQGKRLAKFKNEYDNGIKRFLGITDERIAADLEGRLKMLREQIAELEAELAAPEKVNNLAARLRWWQGIRPDLVEVPDFYVRYHGGMFPQSLRTKRYAQPSVLRELLQKMGVKVTLWFSRGTRQRDGKPSRQYVLSKGKLEVADRFCLDFTSSHFDSPASLIVWCGERKGRTAKSGWPGFKRPTAL
jgi:DNA invertase Pin-like site-specific DNA recombinase